jgi:GAF domain-containing protein
LNADPHERKRLEALAAYRIVDSEQEPEFDDIVLIASELCKAPVALVSLVERDRQWFKATVGFQGRGTPIQHSICAHALGSHDLLIVPDLSIDPRTAENPLVTGEPHIRFYSGAPLVVPD